jgi:calcineurin-like phosphoesterase family protein
MTQSRVFYSADLHFNHENILKPEYTARPWKTVSEMNEALINNYNSVVTPEDIVYILGDFAMGNKDEIPGLVARMNGHKHLVLGNHDYRKPRVIRPQILAAGFESIQESLCIQDGEASLFLCHEPQPMDKWPTKTYHLCGHVHNSFTRAAYTAGWSEKHEVVHSFNPHESGLIVNVGVDVCNYFPMTLEQLLNRPFFQGARHRI